VWCCPGGERVASMPKHSWLHTPMFFEIGFMFRWFRASVGRELQLDALTTAWAAIGGDYGWRPANAYVSLAVSRLRSLTRQFRRAER
jgi:hypothetical protein